MEENYKLSHLRELEAESIHIIREVAAEFENPVMLYSIGKDSSVMVRLAEKAFYPGKVPFPLMHIDSKWKFREMIEFRDQYAKEHGWNLIVESNMEAFNAGVGPFTHGSKVHTDLMKTQALLHGLDKYRFDAAFGGARRDEEKSRAKERIFSFRDRFHQWDPKNQRPELWDIYNAKIHKGESIRVFPLSNWDKDEQKDLLRLLTAGSVDDGKSTLIGRLLFDSKKLYEDQLAALERDSKRVGNAGDHIDYALLCDGLKAEREQGITIDVAYRYFSTNNRKFIIADTPGHEQYTRNMITGGSTANLAIILVDARLGVITQTCRHTFLVSLLGIKHVVLAVNKMDLVGFSEERFNEIVTEYKKFVGPLGIPDVTCIPLSALDGDNVVQKSERTPWYKGTSLLELLETVSIENDHNLTDFRFPVQYVLRPNLDFRGFCGKVASGVIHKGDEVMALPSGKKSHIKSIVTYDGELEYAFPPQAVTLTLEDEIDVSRGDMLVHADNVPVIDRNFEAMLVWMDEEAMDLDKSFFIKHTTNTGRTRIDSIKYKVDVNTMEHLSVENGKLKKEDLPLQLNQIARVTFTTAKPLFFDSYQKNKACGSFILIDPITNNTSAVGMIIDRVEAKDMLNAMEVPTLNLAAMGIGEEHYEAIEKVVKELDRQGISVKIEK